MVFVRRDSKQSYLRLETCVCLLLKACNMSPVASIVETSRKDTPLGFDAMGSKAAGVRVHVRVGLVGSNGLRMHFKWYAATAQANGCV